MLGPSIRILLFCVVTIFITSAFPQVLAADPAENDPLAGSVDSENPLAVASVFDIKKTPNVRYCQYSQPDGPSDGLCDVYLPQPKSDSGVPAGKRWPVILLVHGGGWAIGDKWTMDRHARKLVKRGFAAVSVNYRLAPTSKFPDQVDDIRSALVWITQHAKEYSFDPQRVGLYGYSAGGHLVSLVATLADEPWDTVRRTTSWSQDDVRWKAIPAIGAVCIGGPPTDFRSLPLDNTSLAFFLGGSRRELPNVYVAASPICFTSPKDPPFQIIHGEADGIVSIDNSKEFHRALVKSRVDASIETLPKKGHFLTFISPQLTDWMLSFFEKQLSPSE